MNQAGGNAAKLYRDRIKDSSSVQSETLYLTAHTTEAGMKKGVFTHLVEDVIELGKDERFSEVAEVMMLMKSGKTSYEEAAKVLPSKQKITKTTVINKVHGLAEELPDIIYE